MEVDKTIDKIFLHHHGLGYCPTIAVWQTLVRRRLKEVLIISNPKCRAEALCDAPGSSPLDRFMNIGQLLLMGILDCGSIPHDRSYKAFVAVGVNVSGAASDVSVDEGTDLVGLCSMLL